MTKILVTLNVPSIEMCFDVYLPINKKIGTIKKYLINTIMEMSDGEFNVNIEKMKFIDQDTGKEYENQVYLKESGIKNGTQIMII